MKGALACDACTLLVRLTIVSELYDDGFQRGGGHAVLASSAHRLSVAVDEVVDSSRRGNAVHWCAGDGLGGAVLLRPGSRSGATEESALVETLERAVYEKEDV